MDNNSIKMSICNFRVPGREKIFEQGHPTQPTTLLCPVINLLGKNYDFKFLGRDVDVR
jgi:hypothetical protein